MNYASIKLADCANGPGARISLFVSGCRRHCKGCFNSVAWDFNSGQKYTTETQAFILDELIRSPYDGISFLGGEPLEPENQYEVIGLAALVKMIDSSKTTWLYTGYTLEQLHGEDSPLPRHLLFAMYDYIDILVDGPFIEAEKDISLRFRGSRNQRIIDMKKSFEQASTALADEWMH